MKVIFPSRLLSLSWCWLLRCVFHNLLVLTCWDVFFIILLTSFYFSIFCCSTRKKELLSQKNSETAGVHTVTSEEYKTSWFTLSSFMIRVYLSTDRIGWVWNKLVSSHTSSLMYIWSSGTSDVHLVRSEFSNCHRHKTHNRLHFGVDQIERAAH